MMKLVVFVCMLAAASASVVAPLAYSAPFAYGAHLAYSAPLLTPYGSNYRGPLSLAPGQPANILAADGRPLDTLEVNLDRSAHLVSKALDGGVHLLKKRSVIAPIAPIAGHLAVAPAPLITHTTPLAYSRISPISHITSYGYPYGAYW